MKHKRKILIIVIVILILISSIYLIFKEKNKKKEQEQIEYTYELKKNTILLMDEDKIVNFYNCEEECFIYNNYFNKTKVLVKENNKIYLYDLLNNKKISKDYDNLYFLYNNNTIEYFLVETNSLYGIIDINGMETIDISYKQLGLIKDNTVSNYDIVNDTIVAELDDKYGILSISSGKGIIDFQYQNILINKETILAQTEKGWSLINKQNLKLNDNTYEEIFIYKNYFLAKNLNELFLVTYEGNIISNKIDITNKEYEIDETEELKIIVKEKNKKIIYKYQEETHEFVK